MHIVSDTSQPGVPQNNAVAERLVQYVLEGTRKAFGNIHASTIAWNNGLPGRKVAPVDGERTSPWEKTHGEQLMIKLIPFGAKVIIKPSETKGDPTSVLEPTTITGVFAGYELAAGCRWSGICMVWSL